MDKKLEPQLIWDPCAAALIQKLTRKTFLCYVISHNQFNSFQYHKSMK